MSAQKQFGDLSQFKGRDVELFRSSDLNNTAIYFTKVEDANIKTAKAFFDILRFGFRDGGDHQIYVRFPDKDYFVEMLDGGMGSAHGDMMEAKGKNVWAEYDKSFTIYSIGDNLLFVIGEGGVPAFNFMTKIGSYNKGNPFDTPYPNPKYVNYTAIEAALKNKFLKIPENIRMIDYIFKTKGGVPRFFVVDSPAYNFKYDNKRFRVIEGGGMVKEYPITKFSRFRDGGTTIIMVTDEDGVEHRFFVPQTMNPTDKPLVPTFDTKELIDVDEVDKAKIVNLLKLELEPVEEKHKLKKVNNK